MKNSENYLLTYLLTYVLAYLPPSHLTSSIIKTRIISSSTWEAYWFALPPGKYGRKNRASRSLKRNFHGNKCSVPVEEDIAEVVSTQETLPEEESIEIVQPVALNILEEGVRETRGTSASAKKLKTINESEIEVDASIDVIITAICIYIFEKLSKCPEFGDKVDIRHDAKKEKGTCSLL